MTDVYTVIGIDGAIKYQCPYHGDVTRERCGCRTGVYGGYLVDLRKFAFLASEKYRRLLDKTDVVYFALPGKARVNGTCSTKLALQFEERQPLHVRWPDGSETGSIASCTKSSAITSRTWEIAALEALADARPLLQLFRSSL